MLLTPTTNNSTVTVQLCILPLGIQKQKCVPRKNVSFETQSLSCLSGVKAMIFQSSDKNAGGYAILGLETDSVMWHKIRDYFELNMSQ